MALSFFQAVTETPVLLPRPLHSRHAAEQLPRAWLQRSEVNPLPSHPTMSSSHPYGKAEKYLLARALPWAFLHFILLQLWLPWIRMLRSRMGSELAETQNWGLDSPAPVSLMSLYLSSCSERISDFSRHCHSDLHPNCSVVRECNRSFLDVRG